MKFSKLQPVGRWAFGQARTFSCSLSASRARGFKLQNRHLYVGVGFSYSAVIVNFGLLVKPMEGNGGNAGIAQKLQEDPDYVWGNGGGLAGGGTLTAGGLDNNQHKCEVWMSVEPSVGGLPVKYYPKVGITYKAGTTVVKDAVFHPLPLTTPTAVHWDLAGNYLAYMGEIVSRDVTKRDATPEGDLIKPTIYLGLGGLNPTASVTMTWASVEWKMGEDGEKEWMTAFPMRGVDHTEAIWTQLKTSSGQPLKGHSTKYLPSRVVVEEENPETHDTITKIFTTDPTEVARHAGETAVEVNYHEDITDAVQPYFSITGGGALDENGVCKGQLTVKHGDYFIVTEFQVVVADQTVYRQVN